MTKFASKLGAIAIAAAVIVGATGTAGAQTTADLQAQIAALLAQITALQAQAGTSTTTTTSYTFTRDLTVGSTGADVMELQKFLNANGYTVATTGAGSIGNESTYFGTRTQQALSKFQAAKGITPTAGYFGAKTRAYIATMTTTTIPGGSTTTTGAPLSVILASDNPASANVQKGSANNTVLKIKLTGGAAATTVTGLTIKSYGTTEATGSVDISAVKLYDENGIQLGNNRTPAGNSINFVVVPALTIPANGSKTITVTADIGGTAATTMAIVRYGIESATAISGGTTFTGSYPLIGNSFTIVPAGQLGSVNVSKYGSVPKTTAKVGEKSVVISRFNISAGSNEDIAVNQIAVKNTGTVADSDLSNVYLRKVGETAVLAGPASFSNKKVTFNLSNTINLAKGASVNLEVVADIANGGTSGSATIVVGMETGAVIARGGISGTNTTSGVGFTGDTITLGNETLVVSMSSLHPQGAASYIIKTTNRKDLAKFDVRANGGDVILNSVVMTFAGTATGGDDTGAVPSATHTLTSVGLYDGDSLVSDLLTVNDTGDQTFSLNWTIPANTTKTLTVKGITNGFVTTGNTTVTVAATFASDTGYGLASGEALAGASATPATGATAITVYPTGTVTPSADTTKTPYNQAIVAPSNGVTLGAVKFYAQREDMKLSKLVLTAGATNWTAGDISSMTLYADDGVTQLTNPVNYSGSTYTFTSSDFLNDVIFTKGVYKSILVKGNLSSGASGDVDIIVTVANDSDQMELVGQDSGQTFDTKDDGAIAGLVLQITSPYLGGTFSSDTEVITITKSSVSPSGSVARGSQTVTGIWDVTNNSSTNAAITIDTIKFTSKSGLPSGLVDDTDDALFMLYDGDGTKISKSADVGDVVVDAANGTINFTSATGTIFTVNAGETKQIKLVVNTVNTAKFASNTQLQWSIEAVGDVTGAAVGYAAGTWSIPAVANVVTLP
jgi:hypothetical protein